MEFTEKVQAFVVGTYYQLLTGKFGSRGEAAFVHATQYYAGQRGRRMAQRAIRDGKDLDWYTYNCYGEWTNSQKMIDENCTVTMEMKSMVPDAEMKIVKCPWNEQFKEMGIAGTAGVAYCTHLDIAIARGFNPYLVYEVDQTLNNADSCVHRLKDSGFAGKPPVKRDPANMRDFSFHTVHTYWAYRDISVAVFGDEGREVAEEVLRSLEEKYGEEAGKTVMSYKNTDFNKCGSAEPEER